VISDNRLRILLLAHNVEGIGTYIRFEQLAVQLSRLGHSVTLIAGSSTGSRGINAVEFCNFKRILIRGIFGRRVSNGGLDPAETLCRILYVLRNTFDIVHASEHRPVASLPALLSRRFRSSRYISDWSDWWGRGGIVEERRWFVRALLRSPETFCESRVHRSADAVTVISAALRDRALALGISAENLLPLPNGADTERIYPQSREEARRRLGLPEDGMILVYAGLAPIDMDLIWESFAVVDSKAQGKVYLLVLGRKWPLPKTLDPAREKIIQPGMVERGKYPSYLAAGDIMLLPMRNKIMNLARWPGKLGDYLSAGRPIITNPTGEVLRIMEDEPVGLSAGETPGEFADAILSLLSDPASIRRMGICARKVAEEKFRWEAVVRPLPDFYRRVISRHN
jgi:glycosyltransferase involved in cell wall biosynthesis